MVSDSEDNRDISRSDGSGDAWQAGKWNGEEQAKWRKYAAFNSIGQLLGQVHQPWKNKDWI